MNRTRIAGALLAVALPFAFTGVAGASADTSITLVVAGTDGPAKTVVLECDPPRGAHPHARSACRALHRAEGDFDALAALQAPQSCTLEYQPVLAQAHGTWHGEPVDWTHEFGNGCALRAATGNVFRF
jgi:hypothetical protein